MKQILLTILDSDTNKELSSVKLDVVRSDSFETVYTVDSVIGDNALKYNGTTFLVFTQGTEITKSYIEKQYLAYKNASNSNKVLYLND